MKTTTMMAAVCLAASLSACGPEEATTATTSSTTTASGGSGGGEGGEGGAGGAGGEGGSGGETTTASTTSGSTTTTAPMGCPDPFLSYDPATPDGEPVTAEPFERIAARLAPATSSAECHELIVGIYTDGVDCLMPAAVTIGSFVEPMSIPKQDPALDTIPVSQAVISEGEKPGSFVLRFKRNTKMPAETYPFVVVQMSAGLCLMSKEIACDPSLSWIKGVNEPWAMMGDQLVMGVGDCAPM
jgi:hypothetical protein